MLENQLILKNLQYNEEYARKVLPFLKSEYFGSKIEVVIFEEIRDFLATYSNLPTFEALRIQIDKTNLNDSEYKEGLELIQEFYNNRDEKVDIHWLVDKTEAFCQERALHNAIDKSITIIHDKDDKLAKGSIPNMLMDALSVSFDTSIGHSYFDDSEARYEYYHREEERLPFDLEYFNLITNGGIPKKTLSVILCPPHKGKTLMMCHFATKFQESGKKVLYISCEMAAEEIARRIDANSLNVPMSDIDKMDKASFTKKIENFKAKTVGKMIIREYPTSVGSVTHFRSLLNDLKLKKKFVPDVIFVDYLNIAASSRLKLSAGVNSYTYVLAIAQELRGLAQEFNVPIITATQTTRGASSSSDFDMTDISESYGVSHISDFMIGIINTEEMEALNQIMVKQLKNRFRDFSLNKRFVVGIDRTYMRLYDVESSGQFVDTDEKPKNKFEGFELE